MTSRSRFPGHLLALALATAACGSPQVQTAGRGGSGGAPVGGTGGGPGGGGNMAGGGNPGMGAQPPPVPPFDPGMQPPNPADGGVAEPSCSATRATAMPGPVDLYILQDRSLSMGMPGDNPVRGMSDVGRTSKWQAVTRALTTFVQAPSTAGMNMGLGFFPLNDGDAMDLCSSQDYLAPAIPIQPLPAAAARIVSTLNQTMIGGGTPTHGALEGAIQYARMHQMTTGRRTAIALSTDGLPTGCNDDNRVAGVSEVARMGASAGINTFVIGVGQALADLNAIAAAGGTGQAFLVEAGGVDALIAALKTIQAQASKLACSFNIPPPPMGQMLDANKVNVSFAPMGAPPTAATHISRVAERAACGPMGGWYYDNPMMPAQVNLCDASCNKVNSSPNVEVSVLFGCKTTTID